MESVKSFGGKVGGCCSGFKDFLLRGNVVDLAVAIVVGGAFKDLITAFIADFITPLLAAIGGNQDFSALTFTLNNSVFRYGHFFNVLISFIIICLVIYFIVVVPMNKLISYMTTAKPADKKDCPECLTSIPILARKCGACGSPQMDVVIVKPGV
mmetsp:Transcript_22257/g.36865  ORF Transcript_22257/g.36865 Transcript_22257/m.36865 type:complete len:154 (-) Transcript_22257:388-849(-)|eukprot:CAMPEP_0184646450 /NCGR_PEP_ID=MMETSP0308-20130426/3152_1 /TAXON_ID=38269 /ORGANISM="Gloeochaete witrockiana, Strain SAG 46.84" /LENGTH=153 /DNA_ID=CAMNT_0027076471 /DNA_START=147 /DNA_END=608 /DNA_ORIENTATION=+